MRKRISKQKDHKTSIIFRNFSNVIKLKAAATPILTLKLLHQRTACLQQAKQFEKERITKIVKGTASSIKGKSIQSVKFQEIERNCCFQEYLKQYYSFKQITSMFTDLIQKRSLRQNITFMDFKIKNYQVMSNYTCQVRRLSNCKNLSDNNLTASQSAVKEGKYFKQMEFGIKRITKAQKGDNKMKIKSNNSESFTKLLIKNIEKMLTSNRDSRILDNQQKKATKRSKKIQQSQERVHTSPQNFIFDCYGLQIYRERTQKRVNYSSLIQQQIFQNKNIDNKIYRYQTQYDTQHIEQSNLPSNKQKQAKKSKNISVKKTSCKSKSKSNLKTSLKNMKKC